MDGWVDGWIGSREDISGKKTLGLCREWRKEEEGH